MKAQLGLWLAVASCLVDFLFGTLLLNFATASGNQEAKLQAFP